MGVGGCMMLAMNVCEIGSCVKVPTRKAMHESGFCQPQKPKELHPKERKMRKLQGLKPTRGSWRNIQDTLNG
jgi:hypothetical protein